jgi:hypothetical protein
MCFYSYVTAFFSGNEAKVWGFLMFVLRALRRFSLPYLIAAVTVIFLLTTALRVSAQVDQGSVTGTVQDSSGAVIPNADVTLTSIDNGLALHGKSNGSGAFVFSPVKIGRYKLSAAATGFETTVQEKLQLTMQQQLNVPLTLKPGSISETVTISTEPPALQTDSGAVAQTFSTEAINATPLPSRNWVYMAQLSAGVVATPGSRGGLSGDFSANGQRPDQNNFLLDGVDNNVNIADFQNGSSFNVKPPPDALAEFQVQTSNYSAEFGHSVGAALSASIKSGTNQVHGDVWEFFRNTYLSNQDWDQPSKPPYHENQFGATLGFPIWRDKLFYFGDAEANRVSYAQSSTITVPTALMRTGDFSELLNKTLTGAAAAIQLYTPNSGGGTAGASKQACLARATAANPTGNNVFCTNQLSGAGSQTALAILNMYPNPAPNQPQTTLNYTENLPNSSNTWQWDQRIDYNISAKDQFYTRYSYQHVGLINTAPLGPILDGTGTYAGVRQNFLSESGMGSETHIFNPNLVNEFRFSYNWGKFSNLQENYNVNLSAQLGFGGIPYGTGFPDNGGLPAVAVSGIAAFGSHGFDPSIKGQNLFQILDNLTMNRGHHSLKYGVAFQNIRSSSLSPPTSRGSYSFTGKYTSYVNSATTSGYGVADFLTDQNNASTIGNETSENFARWYRAGYVQDDWKLTKKLTLNLGLRYDYYQSAKEMANRIANLIVTSASAGHGTGIFQLPAAQRNTPLAPAYVALLTTEGVSVSYVDNNPALVNVQKTNFAPRVGFAYSPDERTVFRGGFGIFYGGLEPYGGDNIGQNHPFFTTATFPAPTCAVNNCPSDGRFIETGFADALAAGLDNYISSPTFGITDQNIKTPNTMGYNLNLEHAFTNSMSATIGYVGNVSHRLPTAINFNNPYALQYNGKTTTTVEPFPQFGAMTDVTYEGQSMYNGLQTKVEQRMSHGVQFLATYTWSRTRDDSADPLNGGTSYRDPAIVPLIDEFTNASQDVRNRFTFNGFYQLPFGIGRAYLNHSHILDIFAGGWSGTLTFVAQSGQPFTVTPNNTATAGGSRNAIIDRSPFSTGGPVDPSNTGITCPAKVRTRANWYNPCAFANPLAGVAPAFTNGALVSGVANALPYLGGKSNLVYGPGYNRVNLSAFKQFATFHKEYFEFRADVFNLLNHPTESNPNLQGINSTGGQITSTKSLQSNAPDARFFQLSAKYVF